VQYPLDTIKTKTQSYAASNEGEGTNPFALAGQIVKAEGMGGFYSGVTSTMLGQALIKGVTFLVYEAAKPAFTDISWLAPLSLDLVLAACLSGAVGSFVVTPVERIKCVMQAREKGTYDNPMACAREVLRNDGLQGLMVRGLGATLLREIPAYGFYFVSYDTVKGALLELGGVPLALIPLIGGAAAGAMAWIPVYPVDVRHIARTHTRVPRAVLPTPDSTSLYTRPLSARSAESAPPPHLGHRSSRPTYRSLTEQKRMRALSTLHRDCLRAEGLASSGMASDRSWRAPWSTMQ
jgi:solute carrier family 25 carnitine/acylcarnitine transporter 20/29